jgi:ABC-type phosphate/phosphonate transport system substrate-binding protein
MSTYESVLDDLNFHLAVPVKLSSTNSLSRYRQQLIAGRYDIAVVGPGLFVAPGVTQEYVPLVMAKRGVRFVIVVDEHGPISKLEDLVGASVGSLTRGSASWLVTRELLLEATPDLNMSMRVRVFRTAADCILALGSGLMEACGMAEPILQTVKQLVSIKLRALVRSEPIPGAVYLAHSEMKSVQRDTIRAYLLDRGGFLRYNPTDYRALKRRLNRALH